MPLLPCASVVPGEIQPHASFVLAIILTYMERSCMRGGARQRSLDTSTTFGTVPSETHRHINAPLLTRKTVVLRSPRRSIHGLSNTDGTLRSFESRKTPRTVLRRGAFVLSWGPADAPRFHRHFVVRGGARAALFSARDGTQIAEQRVRGRRRIPSGWRGGKRRV